MGKGGNIRWEITDIPDCCQVLLQCWLRICDAGPTLNQHWVSSPFLERQSNQPGRGRSSGPLMEFVPGYLTVYEISTKLWGALCFLVGI